MRIRVLGSLELAAADRDGGPVALKAPRLRRLLAVLLVHANAVVSVDRLADVVWGDEPPFNADAALQNLVSRLRGSLRATTAGADQRLELLTRSPGYLLRVDRAEVDANRFEDLVARARGQLAADPAGAAELLDEALGLWRGGPYAEFADEDFARAEAARLEELRLGALEDRIDAALALGRHDAAIPVLEGVVADHPMRERPRAQLMLALHRAGRTAEALQCFRDYRERLGDELGLEPSAALQRLERDILRQDDALTPPPAAPIPPPQATQGNLPAALTDLLGRDRELAEIRAALDRARIVTLTGVGGVGKTRLALAAAHENRHRYPDGVWWCELAAVDDAAAVDEAVTTVLGVQQRQGLTVLQRLVEFLRPKRLLLVLDNCEHVLDSAVRLAGAVARAGPGVAVLATSREPLGVEGEQVRPVPPLGIPNPAEASDPRRAAEVPAVALFQERAQAASPSFTLSADNLGSVVEICRRLDGLPLGLELAATRVRSMSPADIADRLQTRFHFLRSGRRIAEDRHRTLRAVVDWSYELLPDRERRAFERLSVFAADFDLAAAERVCGGAPGVCEDVADLLAGLVDKSLVVAHTDGGPTRYRLLETLRHYGRERLEESGDAEAARRAHAEHYVAFVEDAEPRLRGPQEARWVGAVTAELDELRAAQAWALERDLDLALRLSAGLQWYAQYRLISEVFQWAERAAAAAAAAGLTAHPSLPLVWASAAAGARIRGDVTGATEFDHRALAAMEADDPRRRFALDGLADAAIYEGRLDEAFRLASEAAIHAERAGDSARGAYVTVTQAVARAYADDTAAAMALLERARRLADASGSPTARGWVCYGAGEALLEKDPVRALALLEEALQFGRSVQDRFLTGVALVSVASVRGRQGEATPALRLFGEVIEHWHLAGNWTHQWTTLRNVIDLLYRLGAAEPAAVLYGAMTVSRTAPPVYGSDAVRLAEIVDGLPHRLGGDGFAAAVARGEAMADEDAVSFACAEINRALTRARADA